MDEVAGIVNAVVDGTSDLVITVVLIRVIYSLVVIAGIGALVYFTIKDASKHHDKCDK